MKRLFAALTLLATGCGTYDYNRCDIFTLDLEVNVPDQQHIVDATASGLRQLGGTLVLSGGQVIHAKAVDCAPGVGGDVSWDAPTTMKICHSTLAGDAQSLTWVVKHELGHVLGFLNHLDCSTGATMVPKESCYKPLSSDLPYSTADLTAIRGVSRCGSH